MGISNGIGAFAGVSGFILEHLVAAQGNAVGWRISFLIAAGVDLTALITFALFAKGELQEWAKEEEPQQTMQDIVRRLYISVDYGRFRSVFRIDPVAGVQSAAEFPPLCK
ncbi:unnamed protein product [Gongylonema pulchrum]|uniref:MFS domain-containing protein n=1 Tax=Gongylonema pulchrum TaxID=637853 RepID=A0A183EP15_9BILA|nr:unnamed protein product [Gongylonema pulchrum]